MRWTSAAAAVLLLAPLPAAADVTANYDFGKETLTVEVDDSGDYRAEIPGKFALIRNSGIDYIVAYQAATPHVIERKAFLTLLLKMLPAAAVKPSTERLDVVVAQGGEETVAGRRGRLWTIRAEHPGANTIEIVTSSDSDLAPLGAVFANALEAGIQAFGGLIPQSNFPDRVREVMAKGAPLRMVLVEQLRLRSLNKVDVPAARFALPGPVMDASAFDKAMSAAIPSHAEKVEIAPAPEPALPPTP